MYFKLRTVFRSTKFLCSLLRGFFHVQIVLDCQLERQVGFLQCSSRLTIKQLASLEFGFDSSLNAVTLANLVGALKCGAHAPINGTCLLSGLSNRRYVPRTPKSHTFRKAATSFIPLNVQLAHADPHTSSNLIRAEHRRSRRNADSLMPGRTRFGNKYVLTVWQSGPCLQSTFSFLHFGLPY